MLCDGITLGFSGGRPRGTISVRTCTSKVPPGRDGPGRNVNISTVPLMHLCIGMYLQGFRSRAFSSARASQTLLVRTVLPACCMGSTRVCMNVRNMTCITLMARSSFSGRSGTFSFQKKHPRRPHHRAEIAPHTRIFVSAPIAHADHRGISEGADK